MHPFIYTTVLCAFCTYHAGSQTSAALGPEAPSEPTAQILVGALARWELESAVGADDPVICSQIEALHEEALVAISRSPNDSEIARAVSSIAKARSEYRAAIGADSELQVNAAVAPQSTEAAIISETIGQILQSGRSTENREAIRAFGARAVPALEDWSRRLTAETTTGPAAFALECLAWLDIGRYISVAAELAQPESFLVRQALLQALPVGRLVSEYRSGASEDQLWEDRGAEGLRPRNPQLTQLLDLWFSESGLSEKHLTELVGVLLNNGYLPESAYPLARRFPYGSWTRRQQPSTSTWPFYVAGLENPDFQVRRDCASILAYSTDAGPLLGLVGDLSAPVRTIVASSLGVRSVYEWVKFGAINPQLVFDPLDERRWAAIFDLLDDPESDVWGAALQSLRTRLVSDEQRARIDIDRLYANLNALPNSKARGEALSILWQIAPSHIDGDGRRLDDRLVRLMLAETGDNRIPFAQQLIWSGLSLTQPQFWSALELLYVEGNERTQADAIATVQNRAAKSRAAADQLWGWLEGRDDSEAWRRIATNPRTFQPWLTALDDRGKCAALIRIARVDPRPLLLGRPSEWAIAELAPYVELIRDSSAPMEARFSALNLVITDPAFTPEESKSWLDIDPELLDKALIAAATTIDSLEFARTVIHNLDAAVHKLEGDSAGWLMKLLADDRISDRALSQFWLNADARPERLQAVISAVITRFPAEQWSTLEPTRLLLSTVKALRNVPSTFAAPILRLALRRGEVMTSRGAIEGEDWVYLAAREVIASVRAPEYLQLLREHAEADKELTHIASLATAAAGFLTEDAAQFILYLAGRSANGAERQAVLEALDQVSNYLDAKARWQQRRDAADVRATSIRELVGLIEAEGAPTEQRAAALRGLGVLEAVEELPRIVRALGSPEPIIVEAAKAALARLESEGR